MFRVNEACNGVSQLSVKDGRMIVHVSLASKNILNLYLGKASDAVNNEHVWLKPTVDTVTYSDGLSDKVFGFDIPFNYLDEEFDIALVGKKGTWYDHKVKVSLCK